MGVSTSIAAAPNNPNNSPTVPVSVASGVTPPTNSAGSSWITGTSTTPAYTFGSPDGNGNYTVTALPVNQYIPPTGVGVNGQNSGAWSCATNTDNSSYSTCTCATGSSTTVCPVATVYCSGGTNSTYNCNAAAPPKKNDRMYLYIGAAVVILIIIFILIAVAIHFAGKNKDKSELVIEKPAKEE